MMGSSVDTMEPLGLEDRIEIPFAGEHRDPRMEAIREVIRAAIQAVEAIDSSDVLNMEGVALEQINGPIRESLDLLSESYGLRRGGVEK